MILLLVSIILRDGVIVSLGWPDLHTHNNFNKFGGPDCLVLYNTRLPRLGLIYSSLPARPCQAQLTEAEGRNYICSFSTIESKSSLQDILFNSIQTNSYLSGVWSGSNLFENKIEVNLSPLLTLFPLTLHDQTHKISKDEFSVTLLIGAIYYQILCSGNKSKFLYYFMIFNFVIYNLSVQYQCLPMK